MDAAHLTRVVDLGEGAVQAVCDCGWRSPEFGRDKRAGAMDALQHAKDAADLHQWDRTLNDE